MVRRHTGNLPAIIQSITFRPMGSFLCEEHAVNTGFALRTKRKGPISTPLTAAVSCRLDH